MPRNLEPYLELELEHEQEPEQQRQQGKVQIPKGNQVVAFATRDFWMTRQHARVSSRKPGAGPGRGTGIYRSIIDRFGVRLPAKVSRRETPPAHHDGNLLKIVTPLVQSEMTKQTGDLPHVERHTEPNHCESNSRSNVSGSIGHLPAHTRGVND
jgi:hypothetical protein